jgi:hypothetical protein
MAGRGPVGVVTIRRPRTESAVWVRQDKRTVLRRLAEGAPLQTIAPQADGALEELVALSVELGTFELLDAVAVKRQREGIPDRLLLHTLAVLPFLAEGSLSGSAKALFAEPAILVQLGYAPVQLQQGVSTRHRRPSGKTDQSVPIHPDSLRDELARLSAADWESLQRARLRVLYTRGLIRSRRLVVDGSGLGPGERVVVLSVLTGEGLVPLVWVYLTGDASEKGKEAAVTRRLLEVVREVGGPEAIKLLLADAYYADGPLLAWLQSVGIDALVRLPEDRLLWGEAQSIIELEGQAWAKHQQLRVLDGRKEVRTVEVASAAELTDWDSYVAKAKELGLGESGLWVGAVRQLDPRLPPDKELTVLVSTRPWKDAWEAYQAYRGRWWQENAGFNELKEGWLLERYPWGRDEPIVRGRVGFTLLAQQVVALYRQAAGRQLAGYGIRRLRQALRYALGGPGVVVVVEDRYAVVHVEELMAALGHPVGQSLRCQLPSSGPAGSASKAAGSRRR